MPVEAKVTLPALRFAYAMNSATECTLKEFGTIIRFGIVVTRVTGARSSAGL